MPLDHPFRAAIIGAGLMGQWHARYAARSGAKIAFVVDPQLDRARLLASTYPGATACATLAECLTAGDVEAAHVCAPAEQHFALCLQTLEGGLHTLVEKPAAASASETELLLAVAHTNKKRFGVNMQLPFQQGFFDLLQRRESLGEAVRVEFHAATAGGEGLDAAGRQRMLWEILPHPLSVFAALFGTQAWEADWRIERFDDQELELSAQNSGASWLIFLSLRERPRSLRLTFRGSKGRGDVDFYHGYLALHSGADTRADKIGRPFLEAGIDVAQAGGNLARRALRGEAAYPGLADLISRFYMSIDKGPLLQTPEELMGIARMGDFVLSKRRK